MLILIILLVICIKKYIRNYGFVTEAALFIMLHSIYGLLYVVCFYRYFTCFSFLYIAMKKKLRFWIIKFN